jgi:hypothetical protein
VSPRWEHDSTHNSRKTVDTTKAPQLPLPEPHHPDDRGLLRGHSWPKTMKRKSKLLLMSLTLVASSLLLNLACFTWRSDGVSFRCFGGGLYIVGIILGNTPFYLSFFCSVVVEERDCLYGWTLLLLDISFSELEFTLYQDQRFCKSRSPLQRVCTMFLKCFCVFANVDGIKDINCKKKHFSLSLPLDAQRFPRSLNRKGEVVQLGNAGNGYSRRVVSQKGIELFLSGLSRGIMIPLSYFGRFCF